MGPAVRPAVALAAMAALVAATAGAATAAPAPDPAADQAAQSLSVSWQPTPTGSTSRFRGLSAVSASVAWVGGLDGTVLRTTDAGATWASVGPEGAASL